MYRNIPLDDYKSCSVPYSPSLSSSANMSTRRSIQHLVKGLISKFFFFSTQIVLIDTMTQTQTQITSTAPVLHVDN